MGYYIYYIASFLLFTYEITELVSYNAVFVCSFLTVLLCFDIIKVDF